MSRDNPTVGHSAQVGGGCSKESTLYMRLLVGSHLAQYLRHQLEEHQGFTSTVGVSTSKLISKLVGNINKPKGQTTLLPPYSSGEAYESNVIQFLDSHEVGKIPGVGFKMAQKIRGHVLGRPAEFDTGIVYGGTKEKVTVKDVRLSRSMNADLLEKLIGGPGAPKEIGFKVWALINGDDNSEVSQAREVPQQISIVNTMTAVYKELRMLSMSLLSRVREDLLRVVIDDGVSIGDPSTDDGGSRTLPSRQWIAYPRTLRLTTRPRLPLNSDGTRPRSFNRISRSCDMPSLILDLRHSIGELSERLVQETLIPLFHKLHPKKSGWNLSLVNLCATNMSLTAASSDNDAGRDISKMFKRQEYVLKEWKGADNTNEPAMTSQLRKLKERDQDTMDDVSTVPDAFSDFTVEPNHADDPRIEIEKDVEDEDCWQSDDTLFESDRICTTCGLPVPYFATAAHVRFHNLPD
ncbi:MAG: hypothetical protein Q9219_003576 [cf. Caloplaca sp. 3 TL-2023]